MEESIFVKYERLRPQIKDGDIILFHGTKALAKIIQNCDLAYWNHVGVIIEKHGALYIEDANGNGVQSDRLSWRIAKYPDGDFTIIQSTLPKEELQAPLAKLLLRADHKTIKYDFWNGFKELLNRKFDWQLTIKPNDSRDICSNYLAVYAVEGYFVHPESFKKLRIEFPQDFERYRNINTTKFLE